MESRPSPGGADQREYVLTTKGRDLEPVILALSAWGDQWAAPNGPPILYHHASCGGPVRQYVQCETCQIAVGPGDTVAAIGPGMPENLEVQYHS